MVKAGSPAEAAEASARDRLSKSPTSIEYKTGKVKGSLPALWKSIIRERACIMPKEGADPSRNPKALLEDYYQHAQELGAWNPLVSEARQTPEQTGKKTPV